MKYFLIFISFIPLLSCNQYASKEQLTVNTSHNAQRPGSVNDTVSEFRKKLSEKALSIIDPNIKYTPDYIAIGYPNGDVPAHTGVCTDVIIRAYRKLDIDLQKEVHEDMKENFNVYPKRWGLSSTDTNIDHRRVPNLETFFRRKGKELSVTQNPNDYQTGAIVTWIINGKLPHIGIVTNQLSDDGKRRLIVHNVGNGQILEDCLFKYTITGHFVYEK